MNVFRDFSGGPKNWCFWTMVLEKTLASPLDYKEIQPVYPKGDQSWVFIGRTYAEAETPILWPPHVKCWLTGKDPDAGRDWGQEEKGTTEDEMAGWHHWLNEHESEWTPGVGDGQGGLAYCDTCGRKESDTTEWLNWTELVVQWLKFWVPNAGGLGSIPGQVTRSHTPQLNDPMCHNWDPLQANNFFFLMNGFRKKYFKCMRKKNIKWISAGGTQT